MRIVLLAVAFAIATTVAAVAQFFPCSLGSTGLCAPGNGGTVSCASTGIFNLGNVCNDIYFIGALK